MYVLYIHHHIIIYQNQIKQMLDIWYTSFCGINLHPHCSLANTLSACFRTYSPVQRSSAGCIRRLSHRWCGKYLGSVWFWGSDIPKFSGGKTSSIKWDLTHGPLNKSLELVDTQVEGSIQWVLLEISWTSTWKLWETPMSATYMIPRSSFGCHKKSGITPFSTFT